MYNEIVESTIICLDSARYRVIYIDEGIAVLCQLEVSKLNLITFSVLELNRMLRNEIINTEMEETQMVFDITKLPEKEIAKYEQKRKIIQSIKIGYAPTFLGLLGKSKKEPIMNILQTESITAKSLWKIIREYLQSGCQDISLINKRYIGNNTRLQYQYKKKAGRHTAEGLASGLIITEDIAKQFNEFLEEYKKGREKTFKNAYIGLINKYYSNNTGVWSPTSERPSINQFYRYCEKHLSKEEKDIIKTNKAEQRNNKRLLISSSRIDAIRPGYIVECDALEADFSIVSEINKEQCIGRPIVYFMIDVYSSAIVAVSASYENNSVIGLTNLFINLGEDKVEYARKYDIDLDPRLWPSNFIPVEIRCDRGSDFKSDKFGNICKNLGIKRTLEPGATGSMKGIVEQSFHQFQSTVRTEMEGKGLITRRYDSNHHRESMITLTTFIKILINYVIAHNQKYINEYPMEKEMYHDKTFKPVPFLIWEYGCCKKGAPNKITLANYNQYLYNLMIECKASVSRRGIKYKNLFYLNSDEKLLAKMYSLGTHTEKITIRIDPRDVNTIYYVSENELVKAVLNKGIPGNADFCGMTWNEYDEYFKHRNMIRRLGKSHNLEVDAKLTTIYQNIIEDSKTNHLSNTDNIREHREAERQKDNKSRKLSSKIIENSPFVENTEYIEATDNLTAKNKMENNDKDNMDPFSPNLDFKKALQLFKNK